MAEIVGKELTDEKCPDCKSRLLKITISFSLPEEPGAIVRSHSCSCGYICVLNDDLDSQRKTPYIVHRQVCPDLGFAMAYG